MPSELEKLKAAQSLNDLADLLGYKPRALSFIVYKIPEAQKYNEFTIPKKNGEERLIKAPTEKLKKLQKKLAMHLNDCLEETLNEHKHSLSHGFRKNHSIVTNAKKHKNKRYVFNVDLENFFPSLNFGRVRGFFIKNKYFCLDPKIATIIAQIACFDNELPQGSPCSPVISNLIGHIIDIRMVQLAKKAKCTYSRYADDLTFSTNQKNFPELIAKEEDGNWVASERLKKDLDRIGFSINPAKTSLQCKTSRQVATGLVVNSKVNVKNEYYKSARSMCCSLFNTNEYYVGTQSADQKGATEYIPGTIRQLTGIINFIYNIKKPHDEKSLEDFLKQQSAKPTGIRKLYRDLLFYKHFHALEKPLIICEGKTDNIYLKCALRQLYDSYPNLLEKIDENGKKPKYNFNINFLNITKILKEIIFLAKGTSGLTRLMGIYETAIETFPAPGLQHPVIILIDNDSGAKAINNLLNQKNNNTKNKTNFSEKSFTHYTKNLYVIHIPDIKENNDTAIEDLFEQKVLETLINGKKFNRNNEKASKNEYGKIVFAKKVIKSNQNSINFDGFKCVLDRIVETIEDYNNKIPK